MGMVWVLHRCFGMAPFSCAAICVQEKDCQLATELDIAKTQLEEKTTHGAQMDCLNFAVSMSCLPAACLTKTSSACLMRILVYLHFVA